MNKKLKIVLLAVAALVALSFARDFALKFILSGVAGGTVGARVEMRGFSMSVLRQSVTLSGLRVHNPKGFPRGVLADLPKVYVNCDLPALLSGKLHLRRVDLEMKEIHLIKNKEGKLNVDALKPAQEGGKKEKKPAKEMLLQIDLLNLKMGRVIQKDYTTGDPPSVQVHELGIEKSYKNITSPYQLTVLILTEPMKQAGIRGAAIYGAAALTGVGLIPVAAAAMLGGKDSAEAEFTATYDRAYQAAVDLLGSMGTLKVTDRQAGVIKADLPAAGVTVELERLGPATTRLKVSARKMMLPKKDVAQGVLYQLTEKLK